MVEDFRYCHVSGDGPDRIDPALIHGVHGCDSRRHAGGHPNERPLRDVAAGAGVLDKQEWVDAVKATGCGGLWSGELFCRRQHQDDSFAVAERMNARLMRLPVLGGLPKPRRVISTFGAAPRLTGGNDDANPLSAHHGARA